MIAWWMVTLGGVVVFAVGFACGVLWAVMPHDRADK